MNLSHLVLQAIEIIESGKSKFLPREKYIMGLIALKFEKELSSCGLLGSFSITTVLKINQPNELLEFLLILKKLYEV